MSVVELRFHCALEAAGVIFIPANGGSEGKDVGVRLRRSPATPPSVEPRE